MSSLPWPAAFVLIALAFHRQIIEALPRLREAGPTGVKLDAVKEQESKPISDTGDQKLFADKATPKGDPTYLAVVDFIKAPIIRDLASVAEDEKISALIEALAKTRLELFFEKTYRLAFGSQIVAIRRLDEQGEADLSQAKKFYETYEKQDPDKYAGYGFEGWSNFITSNGLAEIRNGKISSTNLGHQFLIYMTALRLTELKPL